MLWIFTLFLAAMLPAQTSRPVDLKNLPADWPPLPDFKHTVDYIKWWEDRVNGGLTDDAAPLWAELRIDEEQNPQPWGWDADKGVPGLLTGFDPLPDRYAWDPRDHPGWEKAFQSQKTHGLTEKLIAVSRHRQLSAKRVPMEPKKGDPLFDAGLAADDNLLTAALFESRALHRHAVKVLLQNAWRAPEGKVDGEAMEQAVTASLRMAHQFESSNMVHLHMLLATAIRSLVYRNVLEALNEGVLDAPHVESLDRWLASEDRALPDSSSLLAGQVAAVFDLLQYLYVPKDGNWRMSPQPNDRSITVFSELAKLLGQTQKDMPIQTKDLTRELTHSDPGTAVGQIVQFHLRLRDIFRSRLPWEDMEEQNALLESTMRDPSTHPAFRLHLALFPSPYYQFGRIAECEADRRATRIVLALHRYHNQTGRWPDSLDRVTPRLPLSVITDPFSGKPFIYRLEDGKPLLYSTGYNAKDDGGKHKPYLYQSKSTESAMDAWDVDYVYWPVQKVR